VKRRNSGADHAGALARQWQRLCSKLDAKRHLLAQQGSLVRKRVNERWYAYLRYFEPDESGSIVHRSVYVGPEPELARRVEQYLRKLRATQEESEEILELVRMAKILAGMAHRQRGRSTGEP